jgi:large subunit ribosomal protein L13
VVNAAKITLSGNKADQKMYRYHTQYPGGLKEINYRVMMQKNPERVVELAVKGMLPKNALGRAMYRKLKVYAGPEHNHAAQKPEILTLSI